ncbi:MAG: hypothetical protein H6797_02110 [Candidatus Nomurabacteria bacterium]|nr:MAG: hypothetical protein H6797_02110 [Candidatus Nomurabacteria bacterium]
MVQLAHATKALAPRSDVVRNAAWVYAAVLTVMAVAQLFAFEDFVPMMANYSLPGGHGTAILFACLIVFTEVFAVPFLLRMPLSQLMRWVGLACSVLAPLMWVKLAVVGIVGGSTVVNSGLLGTKVTIHAGVLSLIVSIVLLALSMWTAWGLWPTKNR